MDIKQEEMRKVIFFLGITFVVISMSSCATIFNGTKQKVTINSQTEESKIYVDNNLVGTNNATIKLARKDAHAVTVKKDGCKSEIVYITPKIRTEWFFLTITNPFAIIVDAPSGAWKSFDKTVVTVDLDCNKK